MTQDEIIEMAREAGICSWLKPPEDVKERLEIFAKLVAAKEREACAKVEDYNRGWNDCLFASGIVKESQRTWQGLTDEEVKHEWVVWRANVPRYAGFAKGIEAKLKEKNNA